MTVLLEINGELLYESLQLQSTMTELKSEAAAKGIDGSAQDPSSRRPSPEEAMAHQDYNQCMRRLQGNLSYLATLADRKSSAHPQPCPTFMTAPPMNLNLKIRPMSTGDPKKTKADPMADREERAKTLTELYAKLQSLFPGIDPKKEPFHPPRQQQGQGQAPGGGGHAQAQQGLSQGPNKMAGPHGSPVAAQHQGPPQMSNAAGGHQHPTMVPS